jgi:hypothetical protein
VIQTALTLPTAPRLLRGRIAANPTGFIQGADKPHDGVFGNNFSVEVIDASCLPRLPASAPAAPAGRATRTAAALTATSAAPASAAATFFTAAFAAFVATATGRTAALLAAAFI